jgi:hypothetical protein
MICFRGVSNFEEIQYCYLFYKNILLNVSTVSGEFVVGENIVGSSSGASYPLRTVDVDTTNDGYSANDEIEIEADKIIDFSESNPFGMP